MGIAGRSNPLTVCNCGANALLATQSARIYYSPRIATRGGFYYVRRVISFSFPAIAARCS